MNGRRTYLDYNASAPLRSEARAAMCAALYHAGNASSVHAEGRKARGIIETAREQVAALINAKPSEVVFTSGATEANNWALRAGWQTIFLAAAEHESVLMAAGAAGAPHVALPVTPTGSVYCGPLSAPSDPPGRSLLTLQMANNETGVLQDLAGATELAHSRGIAVHTDAAQAAGRIDVDFVALGIDLLSLSAHKFGGPKGVGALVIRDGFELDTFVYGGGQERRRRAGTENVAAIAGFGAAAEAAARDTAAEERMRGLRDRLEAGVLKLTSEAIVIGAGAPRLPNTSCVALPAQEAATLVIKLDLAGVAVGAGSACSSGKLGRSHVLEAIHTPESLASGAIRVSLGHDTDEHDIDAFLVAWAEIHGREKRHPDWLRAAAAHGRATSVLEATAGE